MKLFVLIAGYLKYLVILLQPIIVPLCIVIAWITSVLVLWSIWSAMRHTVAKARQMHAIPCTNCRFFTNNHHLKCTVQPHLANTEQAINCSDFRGQINVYSLRD